MPSTNNNISRESAMEALSDQLQRWGYTSDASNHMTPLDIEAVIERKIETGWDIDDVIDNVNARTYNNMDDPQARKRMVFQEIRNDTSFFPKPNFTRWRSERQFNDVNNSWHSTARHREAWIFHRTEREGFNRRNIEAFTLDDLNSRLTKRAGHELDTETSKFYDWKLGGIDWTLRLEKFTHTIDGNEFVFLIARSIHTPSDKEFRYQIMLWENNKFKRYAEIYNNYGMGEVNLRDFLNI